ncbi:MAG: ABC transporter permease [Deltaproteobacteria bacterium]|nr:ABC transporter permease [Deltaproteobacteria bacterium]
MSAFLLLREALRALARQKLRSSLSTLGIVISVAAVVAMQAVGAGASARISEQMAGLGTNRLVVFPGSMRTFGARTSAALSSSLSEQDADAIRTEVRGVRHVAPVLRVPTQVIAGNQNWPTTVHGTTLEYLAVQSWKTREGTAWDSGAEARGAKQCLLGQTIVDQLFIGKDPMGAVVRLGQVPCEVIGVLDRKGQGARGEDQDDIVLMPLAAARARLSGESRARVKTVNLIYVTAARPEDTSRLEREITVLLRQRHAIGADDEDDFGVRNLAEIAQAAQSTATTVKVLLLVIALISLVVGGIGIMNIMLVSVTERTREIGIRLALGATATDVLLQFLVEAVVLTAIGGAIGVALGAAAARAVHSLMGWNTALDPKVVVVAVCFSALVGVVFGLLPSIRAARLDPIEALRHE